MVLSGDEIRKILVWLVGRLMAPGGRLSSLCARCHHSPAYHRLAEGGCTWPTPDGPPVILCDCSGWANPAEPKKAAA